ncbi:phosphopantetheine-binding protein [Methyloceanibacter sp. wino2]|uniref:phosphopantetheine-binding protein n=1 Tax=Methyloceanibacter sp. wino2 TaxID=2170729 RepID=UPI000D3E5D49|nr:phosphopantetheine-binding protein [Methyloceanibacter sp. wino2]
MTDDHIYQGLTEILGEIAPTVEVSNEKLDAPLADLGLDSLDVSGLLLGIEDKFDLKISDEEAETLNSLRDYHAFIVANA